MSKTEKLMFLEELNAKLAELMWFGEMEAVFSIRTILNPLLKKEREKSEEELQKKKWGL